MSRCVCVWAPSAGVCLSLISLLRENWGGVMPLPVNSVLMLSVLHQGDGCADFRGLADERLGCRSIFLVHSRILWKKGGWGFCLTLPLVVLVMFHSADMITYSQCLNENVIFFFSFLSV